MAKVEGQFKRYSVTVADHMFFLDLCEQLSMVFSHEMLAYAPFLIQPQEGEASKEEPLFQLEASVAVLPNIDHQYTPIIKSPSGDMVYDVRGNSEGEYAIFLGDATNEQQGLLLANADFTRVKLFVAPDCSMPTFVLNNSIMIAYAFSGAYHRLLLVHASVPRIGDTAFIFQGLSGTGKSTHSSLWLKHIEGVELLNDDNPVLQVADNGAVFIWGSPWSGKTPCYRNVRCKLGGCLRLQQAPENRIRRLGPAEAFGSLLASCSNMIWDKPLYSMLGDTVQQVIQEVPSYYLENLPNLEAAMLSYQHLFLSNHG